MRITIAVVATEVLFALPMIAHRNLATWEPYTLMAVGILSGLFGQSVT